MDTLKVAKVDNVVLEHHIPPSSKDGQPSKVRKTGAIHLTPHHLIFSQDPSSTPESSNDEQEIWIPYPSIILLTKLPQSIQGFYPLRIETKYFQNFVFLFEKDQDRVSGSSSSKRGGSAGAEDVWQSIKDSAVKSSVEQLHAFFYTENHSKLSINRNDDNGWSIYNPRNEFTRQGLGLKTKSWRFTDINKDYSFSSTYPNKLVIPTKISDSTLSYASKYRSKARIPVLSYLHWANNASITRSSQPMVGLKNSRSAQDERLVECIFTTHHYSETTFSSPVYGATSTNLIIDARPTTNAMANVAMGAGTENMENYKLGKKAYLGIDNIHVMRNTLKIITEAIRESEVKPNGILDRTLLRKSNWLKHISTILDGSLIIIKNIHLNASHVLIHCSDGWDRTGQLSAISQICLDPFFRTLKGFAILVEKDFLSFGHKFSDRSNHLSSDKYFVYSEDNYNGEIDNFDEDEEINGGGGATKAAQAFFASVSKQFSSHTNNGGGGSHLKEISPVFHQFLDCIRQIQRQFPNRFEFNEQYLLDIYYHLYSCQFGTFLFNNEKQKSEYTSKTISLWDHLLSDNEKSKYLNKGFDENLDKSTNNDSDQGVLLYDSKDVKFWFGLFRRGDEEMNGSPIILNQPQGVSVIGPINSSSDDPLKVSSISKNIKRAISPSNNDLSNNYHGSNQDETRRNLPSSNLTGGGWNWQGFSSGAFNVVSSAGRQIKNISQDAYNQIKAEAGEVEDISDPWKKQSQPVGASSNQSQIGELTNSTIGVRSGGNEIRTDYKPYIPKTNFRIPSESNPWSSTSLQASTPNPSNPSHTNSHAVDTPSISPSPDSRNDSVINPRPATSRINSNPWSTSTAPVTAPSLVPQIPPVNDRKSPSLADLSLNDKPKANTQKPISQNNDEEMIRAAMGDDKKAWDPLGAL
ncbi:uncharacterized protein L201_000302 [Kwoniella dendrophila CBS 6074]|uniref:Myotubularin phosphatase domain-containing protein n=1 Tax=Kwoniella dendrophila CBS 6074 TaxID=1295534 RepID=A0AAX4JJ14_9TREE